MKPEQTNHGVRGSVFAQTPFILNRKTVSLHNILVGDDPCQIRFMELFTGQRVKKMNVVTDEDILGHEESLLLKVDSPNAILLSANVKINVGIWSLDWLSKGTAGVSQIIKYAQSLLDVKLPKGAIERANEMLVDLFPTETGHGLPCVRDVRAGISGAFWILSGEIPLVKPPFWKQPWESSKEWLPRGVNPALRLNKLYRDIVGWTYMRDRDQKAGRQFGLTPSRLQYLEKQKPDVARMDATFTLLSAFRHGAIDPYVTALRISRIWA